MMQQQLALQSPQELNFRAEIQRNFYSFDSFQLYVLLSSALIEDYLAGDWEEIETKLWKLCHYKIICEFRGRLKALKVNLLLSSRNRGLKLYSIKAKIFQAIPDIIVRFLTRIHARVTF